MWLHAQFTLETTSILPLSIELADIPSKHVDAIYFDLSFTMKSFLQ